VRGSKTFGDKWWTDRTWKLPDVRGVKTNFSYIMGDYLDVDARGLSNFAAFGLRALARSDPWGQTGVPRDDREHLMIAPTHLRTSRCCLTSTLRASARSLLAARRSPLPASLARHERLDLLVYLGSISHTLITNSRALRRVLTAVRTGCRINAACREHVLHSSNKIVYVYRSRGGPTYALGVFRKRPGLGIS
jgi:hypothetical protein